MTISVRQVPASEGIQWLKRALALMRQSPFTVHGAFFAYMLTLVLLQQVPLIGVLLPAILAPALFAGLMRVMQAATRNEKPTAAMLYSGFTDNAARGRLLASGVVYCIGFIASLGASALADGGVLFGAMVLGRDIDPAQLQTPATTLAQMISLLALTPTAALFWIAPQLIAWHGMPVSKALFFSFFSFWRNLPAMVLFFAAVGAVLVAIAFILVIATQLLGGTPATALVAMVPVTLFVLAVVYAAFYASYESLVADKPAAPDALPPGDAV
jgi:hypothetical protein